MPKKLLMALILFSLVTLSSCQTMKEPKDQAKQNAAAKIHDQLGLIYLERKDIQRAKQKFLLALELAPDIPESWYSMAYFQEKTGNLQNARLYYEKAVKIAPARGDVLNNYGTFLCRVGDYEKAINLFIKATKDNKYLEIASAYENAGLCSLKQSSFNKAMYYFNKALMEDSNSPIALIELAQLNFRLSHYKEAKRLLHRYLLIASPSVETFRLEKKLEAVIKNNGHYHA